MADKFLKSITFGKTGEKYIIEDAAAKEKINEVDAKVEELAEITESAVNTLDGKINEVDAKAVPYKLFTYTNAEGNTATRKTIQLNNYDTISGVDTKGVGHNLAMLSKWDVADFGAPGVHFNLNTKDNVTINDDLVVATTKDVEDAINGLLALLKEKGVID